MKKLILCLSLIVSASMLHAQNLAVAYTPETKNVEEEAAISWDKMVHDFGTIPQGEPATAEFVLTNNSDTPLIITKVKGSCGCTATFHEDDPVAPGEQTIIKATYNAKKVGAFTKTVKVTTTLESLPIVLSIKGKVDQP
ncbi:MAG: DUF1573 domain-containing protein [Bacteroidota bacterium]